MKQVRAAPQLSPEERDRALALFSSRRFSDLLRNEQFAAQFDKSVRSNFVTFRWMIRLSAYSILASVLVFNATCRRCITAESVGWCFTT